MRKCAWCRFGVSVVSSTGVTIIHAGGPGPYDMPYSEPIPARPMVECRYGPPVVKLGTGCFPLMETDSWCFRFILDEDKARMVEEEENEWQKSEDVIGVSLAGDTVTR